MSQGSKVARLTAGDLLTIRDGAVLNKDARMTNCLMEDVNGKPQVLKRPGYVVTGTAATGIGHGITCYTDPATNVQKIYSVIGNAAYVSGVYGYSNTGWVSSVGPTGAIDLEGTQFVLNGKIWHIPQTGTTCYYKTTASGAWTTATLTAGFSGETHYAPLIAVVGNTAYMAAPFLGTTGNNSRVYSTTTGNTWTLLTGAAAFNARLRGGLVFYNNRLWLIGCVGDGGQFEDVWSSVDGITWTLATAAPAWATNKRKRAAVVVFKNKMWLIGGVSTSGTANKNDTWYSTDGINWTQATAAAAFTASGSKSVITNGVYMYAFGGMTLAGVVNTDAFYSGDGITWTTLGALSVAAPNATTYGSTKGMFFGTSALISLSDDNAAATSYYTYAPTSYISDKIISNFTVEPTEIVDFAQNYAQTTLMIKSKSMAIVVDTASNVASQVINVNYPAQTCRGLVYLDGTFYVMDYLGNIYGSNIDDPATWTALNVIAASTEPDGGQCLMKSSQYVVAFGLYTIEFFFDAGNAQGSPLSKVQNGTLQVGCANGNSVAYSNGVFYFVAQTKGQGQAFSYGLSVGTLEGMNYSPISTDSIERILNADGCAQVYGSAVSMMGHNLYTLTLVTSGITLAYDVGNKMWGYLTTQTSGTSVSVSALVSVTNVDGTTSTATATAASHGFSDGDPVTIAGAAQGAYNITTNITVTDANTFTYQVSSIPVTPATGTITATGTTSTYFPLINACNIGIGQAFQSFVDGYIYTLSETTYTDNGQYIDAKIRTSRIDNDKNQTKFCSWMDVVTDRTDAKALVRYSDNDYQSYSKYRKISLSGKRSRLNRQGMFLRRAWELRHTDNSAFRFQGLDLALEEGIE